MDEVTITVSRETARFVLQQVDNAYISASAHRRPHIIAHRAAAEERYLLAERVRRELFDEMARAVGITENEG